MINPASPAEIIQEYLEDMSVNKFKEEMGLDSEACEKLLKGETRIDLILAMSLSRTFGTSANYWQNLQTQYDQGVVNNGNVSTQ